MYIVFKEILFSYKHDVFVHLLSISNDVHVHPSRAQGKPSAQVLLDLSAAFTIIDHHNLRCYLKSWLDGLSGFSPTRAIAIMPL